MTHGWPRVRALTPRISGHDGLTDQFNDLPSSIQEPSSYSATSHQASRPPRVGARNSPPRCGVAARANARALAAISPRVRRELGALRARDNWRNFVYLALDWGIIVAAIGICRATAMNAIVYAGSVVLIASRQRALMNLVHQASHHKLFQASALNKWAGRLLAGFPLATSVSAYTCAHCRHHGSLWSDEDPDANRYRTLGLADSIERGFGRFWMRHFVSPMLLRHAPFNVWTTLAPKDEARSETLQRLVFWVLVIAAAYWRHAELWLLLFWVVPYCTVFQVIRHLAETAEHAGLETEDPWMATRNWPGGHMTRFLISPHNDHYHLTHHLCPWVPHYSLSRADELLSLVPQYAAAHHCAGYFFRTRRDRPSVIEDIRGPGRRWTGAVASVGQHAPPDAHWPTMQPSSKQAP
jgi:fatty acid desaturase